MTTQKWEDTTTYSRGATERIPSVFTVESGRLKITVLSSHIHYKGTWVMHCFALGIDTFPLPKATSKEEAQQQALKIAKNRLAEFQANLEAIQSEADRAETGK